MPSRTRRSVLAALGFGLATTGCLADSDGSDTEKTTTDDSNATGDWIEQASNEPDPDLPVYLNNDGSETRTVRIWVVREQTGETVFEETHESPGGTEYELYDLKRAGPDGVEAFRVCGEIVASDEETTSGTTANETTTSEATANQTTSSETTTNETSADETTSETSDARGCATVKTNECYGTAHVTVQEDASLQVIYSIC